MLACILKKQDKIKSWTGVLVLIDPSVQLMINSGEG